MLGSITPPALHWILPLDLPFTCKHMHFMAITSKTFSRCQAMLYPMTYDSYAPGHLLILTDHDLWAKLSWDQGTYCVVASDTKSSSTHIWGKIGTPVPCIIEARGPLSSKSQLQTHFLHSRPMHFYHLDHAPFGSSYPDRNTLQMQITCKHLYAMHMFYISFDSPYHGLSWNTKDGCISCMLCKTNPLPWVFSYPQISCKYPFKCNSLANICIPCTCSIHHSTRLEHGLFIDIKYQYI